MEPFVCRATQPIERFGAIPGDEIYFDPSHPDIVILYRPLHIRVSGALLNMLEDGVLEEITPASAEPSSPPRPALRLSSSRAGRALRRWKQRGPSSE